jgi:hypothetical protein
MLKLRCLLLGATLLLASITDSWAQSGNTSQPAAHAQNLQHPNADDQRGTEKTPLIVKILQPPKTVAENAQQAEDRKQKTETDTWLVRWTGAVAIFTLVLGGIGFYQGKQLKRSVDLLAQSERAQMFIVIRNENLGMISNAAQSTNKTMDDGHLSGHPVVWYVFKNYGKTPAIVKELSARLAYFETLPADPIYVPSDQVLDEHMIACGEVTHIPRLQKPQIHHCPMVGPMTVNQAKSVIRAQSYIWFYGRIVYDDIFGNEHEHRFLWRYGGSHGFRPNYEHPKYVKNT